MAEAQSKLPSFKGENKEKYDGPDTSKYAVYKMPDLDKGETYLGEAFYLTGIYENEYDVLDDEGLPTGKKTIKHSAGLHITNHTNEWKIKARINLRSMDDSIEVWEGSALWDIIDSLIEFNDLGAGGKFNVYTDISFKEWQEHINKLKGMTVEITERTFGEGKDATTYNTVRFIHPKEDED